MTVDIYRSKEITGLSHAGEYPPLLGYCLPSTKNLDNYSYVRSDFPKL